jgi:MtrB/PioB family decaheme-associated outer membrane protein
MKLRAHPYPGIAAALATAFGLPLAKADPPPVAPDTSGWKCEQCPFVTGYSSNVEAGVIRADGANAPSGRYTGIDRDGAYADVAAGGQWRKQSGSYGDYSLDRLGLPSREGDIEAGREGQFKVGVSYDGQPTRLYDTASTPYQRTNGQLFLPAGWAAAGTTVGMTQLPGSLRPLDIGFDRRTVDLNGEYFLGSRWTLFAALEHQEKQGAQIGGGAFLTDAVQLAQPIDYRTDGFEVGVHWQSAIASARLSYTGSWFEEGIDSLTWTNPFLPVTQNATLGQLALPPSNNLRQVALSGEARLPVFNATTLSYHFSYGKLEQDAALLPASTLPGSPAVPASSLDGDVHLAHYALGLSSRPLSRLYVRGSATYDGRDDHTPPLAIAQVLTDSLPDGVAVTPRYGEDRTRLEGTADYRLVSWARLGVGGQFQSIHLSPGQVVSWIQDERSWGQATINPLASLSFTVKAGNASRRTSGYNTGLIPPGESPLLRAYDYAPRDTNFFSFQGAWSPLAALTWSLEGTWSDDAYRLTQLGLQSSRDRKVASTVTWTPSEKLSVYLDGSYQRLAAAQAGDIGNNAPEWSVQDTQNFWDVGAGGQWAIRQRWQLAVDYRRSLSRGNDTTFVGSLAEPFPENSYVLESVSVRGTYMVSDALHVHLRFQRERYDTRDWALGGVGPNAVPTLLALGVLPDRYSVNMIALTVQYRFDTARASAP